MQTENNTEKRGRGRPKGSGSKNSTSTETGREEIGSEEGGTANVGAEKIDGLPVLTVEVPKKTPPKKDYTVKFDKSLNQNISLLISMAGGLLADRLGEHWLFSNEEIQAISEPSTRILQRLISAESFNKYTDYVMLIMALGIVLLPRIMEQKNKGGLKDERETKRSTEDDRKLNQSGRNVTSINKSVANGSTNVGKINESAANKIRLAQAMGSI